MSTTVGQKGQVTIERPIREALGIGTGWLAIQKAENGTVVMRSLPRKHGRCLAGSLSNATDVRATSEDDPRHAISDGWVGEPAA